MNGEARAGVRLFLCGDVMTGRGIDQVLPHAVDPRLYEPYITDARRYIQLAERLHGPIPRPVGYDYIWGDALPVLERMEPALRLINLETSVTTSGEHWPGKSVHYRMHPANIPCLTAARIDGCALANNHVLDWGYLGLSETLATLRAAKVVAVGAGEERQAAQEPVVFDLADGGKVAFLSLGLPTSGIPLEWQATELKPGVNLLGESVEEIMAAIAEALEAVRPAAATVVASIHWGPNWGYEIPPLQRQLAHRLVDEAGVDIVHGHSSHHVKGIEVYRDRLILYGCGDLLTDYEGIEGYDSFRGDLSLMYFPEVDAASGELLAMTMVPTQMRRFQVKRATPDDSAWLEERLNREGRRLNTWVERDEQERLQLRWADGG